jgi:hypothetical protein
MPDDRTIRRTKGRRIDDFTNRVTSRTQEEIVGAVRQLQVRAGGSIAMLHNGLETRSYAGAIVFGDGSTL